MIGVTWDMEALLKVKEWHCVCALHEGPDVFVPAEPVGRSRCEPGGMKINRTGVGHVEEV